MSDIFEEVEESLAQERWSRLWKSYGIFVWIAAGLIVCGVGFTEWRRTVTAQQTEARILAFEAARDTLNTGDFTAAEAGFSSLAANEAELADLAAHYLAQTYYFGRGDLAAAAEPLKAIANTEGSPMERLAVLKAAYLIADTASLEEIEALLGNLPNGSSSLNTLARELIAAKAYAAGDVERARREYSYLEVALDAPPGVTQRAQIALRILPPPPPSALDTNAPPLDASTPELGQ